MGGMGELRAIAVEEVRAQAARALSAASGRATRLGEVQTLSGPERRNVIARAVAIDAQGQGRSVIVKATRSAGYDPDAANTLERSGLVREWVATALIAAHAPHRGHGGALLAGDVASGTLVFEDLGADVGSLVDPFLSGSPEAAERALLLYATALARLHADTVGCLEAHHQTLQSIFGAGRERRAPGWRVEKDASIVASKLGRSAPARELALLSARLEDPGPWLCLVHGDPCPDNALLANDRIRLIDYEFAVPGHALLDGIYWSIGFPTCWCAGRVPADVAARVEAVYRAELAVAIPLARDDTAYRTELAYMSAIWLLRCLAWHLDGVLNTDATWGICSTRGRLLSYLEAAIALTGAAGVLPGMQEVAQLWLSMLRHRWPDAVPLPLYPAFATTPMQRSP
jgi:hypothetical protein